MVAGALVGLVNALAITRLRVVPFIATLGMLGIARGTAKWLARQSTVDAPTSWVNELAVTVPPKSWMVFAPGVWIALVLAVVMAFVLRRTVFGRRVFALGSNEAAARACGIADRIASSWPSTRWPASSSASPGSCRCPGCDRATPRWPSAPSSTSSRRW